ncbi:hypothetical protein [Chroococcidiopsis sp. CCNUC1]|nr:hypothetical protein [Chroococcidiopsis sp. CCNUC1]URD50111.1 hypothetical protein M5J74_27900 [Chroococcidiopsis sp. CCNUC1]
MPRDRKTRETRETRRTREKLPRAPLFANVRLMTYDLRLLYSLAKLG